MGILLLMRRGWQFGLVVVVCTLSFVSNVWAQPAAGVSPWETAARNLEGTFTGTLAQSLSVVAIVVAGLMFMFGEGGAKRQIAGIVFGGGLALMAVTFRDWLF